MWWICSIAWMTMLLTRRAIITSVTRTAPFRLVVSTDTPGSPHCTKQNKHFITLKLQLLNWKQKNPNESSSRG